MKIAVYPGSFDPLHIGHKAIIEYLNSYSYFDRVYLVISPHNPFKSEEQFSSARKRFKTACEAIKKCHFAKVKVDDIEMQNPDITHYTINTLDALKAREKENDFELVVGADNLYNIHKWYKYERILQEYGLVVYPRNNYDSKAIKDGLINKLSDTLANHKPIIPQITLIDAPIIDISSTYINQQMANGVDMSKYLM